MKKRVVFLMCLMVAGYACTSFAEPDNDGMRNSGRRRFKGLPIEEQQKIRERRKALREEYLALDNEGKKEWKKKMKHKHHLRKKHRQEMDNE